MCGHRRHRHYEHTVRRDPGVRASDGDRERTADILRDHAGEGRLEPDELEERLEAVFTAKTIADLDALTVDLPRGERHRSPRPSMPFSPLFLLVSALVAVSVIVGHPFFWLFF